MASTYKIEELVFNVEFKINLMYIKSYFLHLCKEGLYIVINVIIL